MNNTRQILMPALCAMTSLGIASARVEAAEFATNGFAQPPGVDILDKAASPPPGVYGTVGINYSDRKATGPGTPAGGEPVTSFGASPAINWVTPWTVLGAQYSVVFVQPVNYAYIGGPINVQRQGMHSTYVAPLNLSWALGDTGLFFKAFVSTYVPDGHITGPAGTGSIGANWWTFQPGTVLTYRNEGWEFTLKDALEINSKNRDTDYKSGDVLHLSFLATKTIGNWTVGPVVTYIGQVSNDSSSAYYHGAVAANRYNDLALGGLVGYNFGPATANFWFTNDDHVTASGGHAGPSDPATFTKGVNLYMALSFRIK